ncbi:MAG: hypothetical protein ACRC1K_24420 [Planctomycetia bacterium]
MMNTLRAVVAAAVVSAAAFAPATAQAWGGRYYSGGHPYHNGYYAVPPASAYEAVSVRPPVFFGAPAYYYPGSYLPAEMSYYPPADYSQGPGYTTYSAYYPHSRAAGFYMSSHAYYYAAPW